jgi:hypothetical protein
MLLAAGLIRVLAYQIIGEPLNPRSNRETAQVGSDCEARHAVVKIEPTITAHAA